MTTLFAPAKGQIESYYNERVRGAIEAKNQEEFITATIKASSDFAGMPPADLAQEISSGTPRKDDAKSEFASAAVKAAEKLGMSRENLLEAISARQLSEGLQTGGPSIAPESRTLG